MGFLGMGHLRLFQLFDIDMRATLPAHARCPPPGIAVALPHLVRMMIVLPHGQ
jgi:hypothetical protein